MPWHMHPAIRAIEEAREATGLYQTLDSPGVTLIKNEEAAGLRTKLVPVEFTVNYGGKQYKAK